jgi:hypothetical protein
MARDHGRMHDSRPYEAETEGVVVRVRLRQHLLRPHQHLLHRLQLLRHLQHQQLK